MSGLSVKYFMWGYQPLFQLSTNRSAQELFAQLLPELDTSLFLVGIKVREQADRLPACVEPDHCSVQPHAFASIDEHFSYALNSDERSQMLYSHPLASQRVHVRLQEESLARAIEACCAKASGQEGRVFIASHPMDVECYAVSCVLSFDRDAYESQQVFSDDVIDRVPVERSLIQAVASEFLACCRDALREDDAGANLCVVKAKTEELLRRGGQRFLESIGWRAFGIDSLENAYRLCDSMNATSAMHYEGSTAAGKFVLCGPDPADDTECVRFVEPVSLRESRRLRKRLELTRGGYSLLVAANGVVGLTTALAQSGFLVDVPGHRPVSVVSVPLSPVPESDELAAYKSRIASISAVDRDV